MTKKKQKVIIIDIVVPADVKIEEKEKRKSAKVPEFEERNQKIVGIEKCRIFPCSDRGPCKCF